MDTRTIPLLIPNVMKYKIVQDSDTNTIQLKVNKINHRCAHALRKIFLFAIKIENVYDIVLERCPYKIPSLTIKTKSVRYYVEPEG